MDLNHPLRREQVYRIKIILRIKLKIRNRDKPIHPNKQYDRGLMST